jgi:DNA-binding response OmpR family regulator
MDALVKRLSGCRVLLVEDEYLIGEDIKRALERVDIEVIGPVPTLDEALARLAATEVDVAVVDIKLHGEMAYPLADQLAARQIPFIFATGYREDYIPDRYRHVPRWHKPFDVDEFAERVLELCPPFLKEGLKARM